MTDPCVEAVARAIVEVDCYSFDTLGPRKRSKALRWAKAAIAAMHSSRPAVEDGAEKELFLKRQWKQEGERAERLENTVRTQASELVALKELLTRAMHELQDSDYPYQQTLGNEIEQALTVSPEKPA